MKNYFNSAFGILLFFQILFLLSSCSRKVYQPVTVTVKKETPTTSVRLHDQRSSETREVQVLDSVAELAVKYNGTPYKYGGTSPLGFDCSGFVSFVYGACGITLPRSSSELASIVEKVPHEKIRPGYFVFFKGSSVNSNSVGHVAIVLEKTRDGFKMIHSTSSRGVILEDYPNSEYWKSRFLFYGKLKTSEFFQQ